MVVQKGMHIIHQAASQTNNVPQDMPHVNKANTIQNHVQQGAHRDTTMILRREHVNYARHIVQKQETQSTQNTAPQQAVIRRHMQRPQNAISQMFPMDMTKRPAIHT